MLSRVYHPLQVKQELHTRLLGVRDFIDLFEVNLQPSYQREYRWQEEDYREFLGHVLSGGFVSPIIINETNDFKHEVVDGKHRLKAFIDFRNNIFPAKLENGQYIYFKDCSEGEDIAILRGITIPIQICSLSYREVLIFYLRYNTKGKQHDKKDLENVKKLLSEL